MANLITPFGKKFSMGEMGLARPYDIIFGTDFGVLAIFNKSHNPFW